MSIRTASTAVLVAVALSLTACGGAVQEQEPRPACPVGYALDGTGEDANECEVDENQDGIGDDDQGFDAEDAGVGAVVGGAAEKARKAAEKRKAKKRTG